jgi:acetyltransferase-like isoleucine patch superfamily enzyme
MRRAGGASGGRSIGSVRLLGSLLRRDHHAGVVRGRDVHVARGVSFHVAPGAQLVLGDGCLVGAGTRIVVAPGRRVELGAGVVVGERCTFVAHSGVTIGAGARLGHGVVIVDFDHAFDDVERPIREQPLESTPVTIGDGATIGLGASILRGVVVGARAIVDPRAVVTRAVPPGGHVGGVPAKPVGSAREV